MRLSVVREDNMSDRSARAALLMQHETPNYRPATLRWPFLCTLATVMVALIAMMGYLCHVLPTDQPGGVVPADLRPMVTSETPAVHPKGTLKIRVQDPSSFAQNGTVIITIGLGASESVATSTSTSSTKTKRPISRPILVLGTPTTTPPVQDPQPSSNVPTVPAPPTAPTAPTPVVQVVSSEDPNVPVSLGPVTLHDVVSTIMVPTTSDGVVSSVQRLTVLSDVVTNVSPTFVTAEVATLTNSLGMPTATITSTPPPISTPTVITLTDAHGNPTATISTSALVTRITVLVTDSKGVVTATLTKYPVIPSLSVTQHTPSPSTKSSPTDASGRPSVVAFYISKGEYFVGYFLPTIVGVSITILTRMIDLSAKQYQPFHELTKLEGASAQESLALRTGGIHGLLSIFRWPLRGRILVLLTTSLSAGSLLLVPLASEALGLSLHGSCTSTDFTGCAMTLGASVVPARLTIGLLSVMIVALGAILFITRRWRTGVSMNPWSIAGIAALSTNPDVRALLAPTGPGGDGKITHTQLARALDGPTFGLQYFLNRNGEPEYGVVVYGQTERPKTKSDGDSTTSSTDAAPRTRPEEVRPRHHQPFMLLSYTARIAFLAFLTGLLIIVLYYNSTSGDTAFERFMDTQSFGVRFLFTLIGIGIAFFWSSFYSSVAAITPYQRLSEGPQSAEQSILISPPLHAITGIWSAIRRRDTFLVLVACTSILSEFMPIFMNNIPFRITQTWVTHMVCTWLAMTILFLMWFVILGSFFIRWPHMPVDPGTMAGIIYYVCDSSMLWAFEGLSTVKEADRNWRIDQMGKKYTFGSITGMTGVGRIGVEQEAPPSPQPAKRASKMGQ